MYFSKPLKIEKVLWIRNVFCELCISANLWKAKKLYGFAMLLRIMYFNKPLESEKLLWVRIAFVNSVFQ